MPQRLSHEEAKRLRDAAPPEEQQMIKIIDRLLESPAEQTVGWIGPATPLNGSEPFEYRSRPQDFDAHGPVAFVYYDGGGLNLQVNGPEPVMNRIAALYRDYPLWGCTREHRLFSIDPAHMERAWERDQRDTI
jgi:hypothetical protein